MNVDSEKAIESVIPLDVMKGKSELLDDLAKRDWRVALEVIEFDDKKRAKHVILDVKADQSRLSNWGYTFRVNLPSHRRIWEQMWAKPPKCIRKSTHS